MSHARNQIDYDNLALLDVAVDNCIGILYDYVGPLRRAALPEPVEHAFRAVIAAERACWRSGTAHTHAWPDPVHIFDAEGNYIESDDEAVARCEVPDAPKDTEI
ncbi:MAG: hypothetical protein WC700_09120 [Gemmatimonadaceae bacterium]